MDFVRIGYEGLFLKNECNLHQVTILNVTKVTHNLLQNNVFSVFCEIFMALLAWGLLLLLSHSLGKFLCLELTFCPTCYLEMSPEQ